VRAAAHETRLFGLQGWDGQVMVGDWEWQNERLMTAGLAHGTPDDDISVQILTVAGDPHPEAVRSISRATGVSPLEPGYESKREAIRDAPGDVLSILVDGAPVEFTMWGGPSRWWAAGDVNDAGVMIESRDIRSNGFI